MPPIVGASGTVSSTYGELMDAGRAESRGSRHLIDPDDGIARSTRPYASGDRSVLPENGSAGSVDAGQLRPNGVRQPCVEVSPRHSRSPSPVIERPIARIRIIGGGLAERPPQPADRRRHRAAGRSQDPVAGDRARKRRCADARNRGGGFPGRSARHHRFDRCRPPNSTPRDPDAMDPGSHLLFSRSCGTPLCLTRQAPETSEGSLGRSHCRSACREPSCLCFAIAPICSGRTCALLNSGGGNTSSKIQLPDPFTGVPRPRARRERQRRRPPARLPTQGSRCCTSTSSNS